MLAHLRVWESLQATSKAEEFRRHPTNNNSGRNVLFSIARVCYVASAWPSVELRAQLKRTRLGPRPSAFSEGGQEVTFHEDKDGSGQISLANAGPFSTLSIKPIGKNSRRIVVALAIDAPLETLWSVLTDYEGLADFLPGLAVCKVEDRWEDGARLFQIGEQNLALGLKFKAKGVINVKELPIEVGPCRICRRIDFEMIEGDFQIFKGTWQMEQGLADSEAVGSTSKGTVLTYVLDVQPKVWLPVRLVEGILSKEIQNNLLCIRNQILKIYSLLPSC